MTIFSLVILGFSFGIDVYKTDQNKPYGWETSNYSYGFTVWLWWFEFWFWTPFRKRSKISG